MMVINEKKGYENDMYSCADYEIGKKIEILKDKTIRVDIYP